MAQAWITKDGVWRPVVGDWLTKDGVWRPVSAGWSTVAGVWRPNGLAAGGGADVNFFTAYPDTQWNRAIVAWDVDNADRVEVLANDAVIYSGPLGTHQLTRTLAAASTTVFTLRTVVGGVATEFGPKPTIVVGSPPAPSNLRVTDTTPFTITFAWDIVPGATAYQLRYSSGSQIYSGTKNTATVTVPDARTSRTVQVRTQAGSQYSTWSSSVTGTSDSPTWRQGSFHVDPVNAYTYMGGKKKWRAASAGLFHGNWGDGRGPQHAALFFGDRFRDNFKADLDKGAEVAKIEIALRRKATGPRRKIQARVHLHKRETKPSGDIRDFYAGTVDVSPSLPKQMDSVVWCELPLSWARKLIYQEGGVKGLSVGMNSQERYFEMSELTTANRVARVRITLR
jgi:hypothetical protein